MLNKIHTILLVCLPLIVFSQEQKTIKASTDATLTFGRYGSDCSGRGICSFNNKNDKTLANTKITYNKDNSITLIVDRYKITTEDEVKIIGKQLAINSKVNDLTLVMEEDFEIASEVKLRLHLPLQLTIIPKGNYPIIITEDNFIITITLK